MTTKPIDDGGPAFPTRNNITSDDPSEFLPQPGSWHGMSLRDWLAGQETLSDYDHPEAWGSYQTLMQAINGDPPNVKENPLGYFRWESEARAKVKLMRANALIAARTQTKQTNE